MCPLFLNSEISISDLHHVHIVMSVEVYIAQIVDVCCDDTFEIAPGSA